MKKCKLYISRIGLDFGAKNKEKKKKNIFLHTSCLIQTKIQKQKYNVYVIVNCIATSNNGIY